VRRRGVLLVAVRRGGLPVGVRRGGLHGGLLVLAQEALHGDGRGGVLCEGGGG